MVNFQSRYVFSLLFHMKSSYYLNSVWFVASWKPLIEFLMFLVQWQKGWYYCSRKMEEKNNFCWCDLANVIFVGFCRAITFTEKCFISKYRMYQSHRVFHLHRYCPMYWRVKISPIQMTLHVCDHTMGAVYFTKIIRKYKQLTLFVAEKLPTK